MANASGPAVEGFIAADFRHADSGVHYRVYEQNGNVWLSYERDDAARRLEGQQELKYFIGSGKRGRTYLFEQQGYWFESPINWYARKGAWDMAPAYQTAHQMPLTLRVDPGCLSCHASGAASSLPDARNHYGGQPFAQGGITCTACHGKQRGPCGLGRQGAYVRPQPVGSGATRFHLPAMPPGGRGCGDAGGAETRSLRSWRQFVRFHGVLCPSRRAGIG